MRISSPEIHFFVIVFIESISTLLVDPYLRLTIQTHCKENQLEISAIVCRSENKNTTYKRTIVSSN